jgi:hypothetical protein
MNYSELVRGLLRGFFRTLEETVVANATLMQKVWLQKIIFEEAAKFNPKNK